MSPFNALINLFEAFSITLFVFLLYNKENRYSSSLLITFTSLFFILVTYNGNYYMSINLFYFISTVLCFMYITILNRDRLLLNILVAPLPSIVLLVINSPCLLIIKETYKSIFNSPINPLAISILSQILLFIIIILLVRLLKYINAFNKALTWYSILSLWCLVTLYYTVIVNRLFNSIFKDSTTLNMFYLETLLIFLVISSTIMIFKNSKKEQQRILEQQLLISELHDKEKQHEDITNYLEQSSKIKHDIKHVLHSVLSSIEDSDITAAKDILASQIENIHSIGNYINTGNNDLDYILNRKYPFLQQAKIELIVSDFCGATIIEKVDFFIIMGNLIDNAIENCKENPTKRILITNGIINSYYYIKIQNTISSNIFENNPNLETTKNDKGIHGIGIKSVYQILNKYNGLLKFDEDSTYFYAKMLIPISKDFH